MRVDSNAAKVPLRTQLKALDRATEKLVTEFHALGPDAQQDALQALRDTATPGAKSLADALEPMAKRRPLPEQVDSLFANIREAANGPNGPWLDLCQEIRQQLPNGWLDRPVFDRLVERSTSGTEDERYAAFVLLRGTSHPELPSIVAQGLHDETSRIRGVAGAALADRFTPEALGVLRKMATSNDYEQVRAARDGMARWARAGGEALPTGSRRLVAAEILDGIGRFSQHDSAIFSRSAEDLRRALLRD